MQRGKKYQEATKLIEREKNYAPTEAIALAKKTATAAKSSGWTAI